MTFSVDRSKTKSINGSDDDKSTSLFSFGDMADGWRRVYASAVVLLLLYEERQRERELWCMCYGAVLQCHNMLIVGTSRC